MNNLEAEAKFFQEVSVKIIELVNGYAERPTVSKQKGMSGDYATELDIAAEEIIVAEIKARFPGDDIMAEEGSFDTVITNNRIWIIDPICGTNNVGRGMKTFCTNIALADNKELIASCVVDHACQDVVWSVGNEVHINDQILEHTENELGVTIDVDLGALNKCSEEERSKHSRFVESLLLKTDYMLLSLNTSLGFAYTATGKLNGFANPSTNPWDICASVFLIKQMGGIVTDKHGQPWHIESGNAFAAMDKAVHAKLIELYKQS